MEDIAQVADRLLVMNHAKVLFCDTPREVFSHATRSLPPDWTSR